MSSSPEASPTSATGSNRAFSMSRDKFGMDLSSPRLQLITNGNGVVNGNGTHLHSPSLKSPNARKVANFSREGILGSAQKARNLSQSSQDREQITNGLHRNGNANGNNNNHNNNSDDGINPLKRRSTDAGIDYPRRRATIAVNSNPTPPEKQQLIDYLV